MVTEIFKKHHFLKRHITMAIVLAMTALGIIPLMGLELLAIVLITWNMFLVADVANDAKKLASRIVVLTLSLMLAVVGIDMIHLVVSLGICCLLISGIIVICISSYNE
jgi:hypothetical protein